MILLCSCYPAPNTHSSEAWDSFIPLLIIGVASSIIGFAGAYFLFWKSIKRENKKALEKEDSESKEFFNFLKFYLERVFDPACALASTFDGLVVSLKERSLEDLMPGYNASFNFRWFYEMDKTKLLKNFLKNFPGTTKDKAYYYNELLSSIDYMDNIVGRYLKDFESYINVGQKFQEMFNENQSIIQRIMDPVIVKSILVKDDPLKLTDFERELMEATIEWREKTEIERRNMYVIFKTLTSSPKLWRLAITSNNDDFISAIRMATFAFKSHEQNTNIHIHAYSSFSKNINHCIRRLKVIVRKMSSVDSKNE